MNKVIRVLNETQAEQVKFEIKEQLEILERLAKIKGKQSETDFHQKQVFSAESRLERLQDELLINDALMSINLKHCQEVGIDFAETVQAIKRSIKK